MGIVKRRTDTLEGEGTVAIGGQSYPTAYWLEVFQEFHETRTGGELPGVVDLEGSLTLIGANAPTSLSAGDAILTLDDGRQIGVVFSSLYNADRSFAFKLGNAMDFGGGEPK